VTGVLAATGIRMSFGGLAALKSGTIEVAAGTIVGLIGRNGSGKSTLFNCITGYFRPQAGKITLSGRDITGVAPHRIVEHGIVRTFQTPRLDFDANVLAAVRCGFYPARCSTFAGALLGLRGVRREEQRLLEKADHLIERLGLGAQRDQPLGTLSMGQVRLVEVARCLAADAKFVLLDEPAAGLTREEQLVLCRQIRELAKQGIGVLLVEHNFFLIHELCEQVTVLDEGAVIFVGTPDEVARDPGVLRSYLGAAAEYSSGMAAE
jgi:ABC-type branched-subunit amino acid transport system ATPase component